MADVVGALPIYLKRLEWQADVIIPLYDLKWLNAAEKKEIYRGRLDDGGESYDFTIVELKGESIDFPLYGVDIPRLFYRDSVYLNEQGVGFDDEPERNTAFQRSVLTWLINQGNTYDIIHCHDHQTGFIPFFIKEVPSYQGLKGTPTMYSIHNGAYNSRFSWEHPGLLPEFPFHIRGLIDWDGDVDAVCAAMRFSDHVNTVSPNYLEEIKNDLAPLRQESSNDPERFSGILNGIDSEVWDPATDEMVAFPLKRSIKQFKLENKKALLPGLYQLDGIPLISFIGRFSHQKGTDLLAPSIERVLARFGFVNFFILGSGDRHAERSIQALRDKYPERIACYIGYNEALAHQIYAASDFILMPSRFEPCGLNQLFGMRYGALTIARETGGLKDTVVDFESGGLGVSHRYASVDDLILAMARALHLYKDKERFKKLRTKAMKMDYSWAKSAKIYIEKYNEIISKK